MRGNDLGNCVAIIYDTFPKKYQKAKMILYNVTIKIEQSLEADWLAWMREEHIPEILKTNLFSDYKLCRLLHEEEDGGVTFAVQYFCENMDAFQTYQNKFAKELQAKHVARYKDRYVAFRTLMEVL